MSERWRCFVAVPLSAPLREALRPAVDAWQAATPARDLRWTDPAGWHLTIAFLGEVDAERVPDLAARLPDLVLRQPPVELIPDGLVAWPRAEEARMAWCRFRPETGIGELHRRVAGSLGVTERRRFRPHVTLARVRGGHSLPVVAPASVELPTTVADEVILYRSHLDPAGTTYEPIERVDLAVVHA